MNAHDTTVSDADHYDVLIIGGGINGAGIAREATATGYSVCLCDAGDFGGGTSSASTKLIHGGLRYLEHYEFRLVRESLKEREVLWKMAPHIIWPMRFVLPHHTGLRPRWLLRLGLFLYDHIGGRKLLPPTKTLNLENDETGVPLKSDFKRAFEYSDCWVEDSRLVILNLQDAQQMGCSVRPRTKISKALRVDGRWQVKLENPDNKSSSAITADVIVNAAGPWVDEVLQQVFGANDVSNIRLVRGSHIVIRKKFEHDRAYIFQNADERIIFAIPYENDFTLIGTTDAEHLSPQTKPEISSEETDYLCKMASEYFAEPVTRDDIVWTYSGVRPLYNDGAKPAQEATRDYVVKIDEQIGHSRLINIFGGKLTTFRKLAKSVLGELEGLIGERQQRTDCPAYYPGGDFEVTGFDDLVKSLSAKYIFLPDDLCARLARLYGTHAFDVLGSSQTLNDLGNDFGHGLYQREVEYLMKFEWAQSAEDVVFRRTKIGIRMSAGEIKALQIFMVNAKQKVTA